MFHNKEEKETDNWIKETDQDRSLREQSFKKEPKFEKNLSEF